MTRIVDFHAHFLPQSIIEAARSGAAWHGTNVEQDADGLPVLITGGTPKTMGSAAYWEDPSVRVERMTAMGVDVQVLSAAPVLFRYGVDPQPASRAAAEINDEIAALIARWPERFLGYATLPLQDTDAAIRELERSRNELGLVGVSVGTHVNGENWDSPRLLPVLQAAAQLRALVFFHPTDQRAAGAVSGYHLGNMIGNPFETAVAVGSLIFGGVLDQLDDPLMLFVHAGGFAYANIGRFDHGYRVRKDAKARAQRLPSDYMSQLYFDCLSHHGQSLRHLLDAVGSSQVVLGTDYPADMGLAEPVAWLDDCTQISAEERQRILSRNAEDLLARAAPGAMAAPAGEAS